MNASRQAEEKNWRAVLAHWYAEDFPGRYPDVHETETAECG